MLSPGIHSCDNQPTWITAEPSGPHHLFRVPPLNTVALEQSSQHMHFRAHIQTTAHVEEKAVKNRQEALLKDTQHLHKQSRHEQSTRHLCSWIGQLNAVNTSLPPKLIYVFRAISVRLLTSFFTEVESVMLQLLGTIVKRTLKTKPSGEGKRRPPDIKTGCKPSTIKTAKC